MQFSEFILDGLAIFIAVPFILLPWCLVIWILKKIFGSRKDKDNG